MLGLLWLLILLSNSHIVVFNNIKQIFNVQHMIKKSIKLLKKDEPSMYVIICYYEAFPFDLFPLLCPQHDHRFRIKLIARSSVSQPYSMVNR